MDLFSRKVIGWSMQETMERKLEINALSMALGQRNVTGGTIHHSDRGSQHTSKDYQERFGEGGDHLQHEPERELLGQCRGGELLFILEARMGARSTVSDQIRNQSRHLSLHRNPVHSQTPLFHFFRDMIQKDVFGIQEVS